MNQIDYHLQPADLWLKTLHQAAPSTLSQGHFAPGSRTWGGIHSIDHKFKKVFLRL